MKTKHHYNTHRRWFAARLAALFFSSLAALLPSPAHGQCEQWDVSGEWMVVQSNGNRVQMVLSVNGTEVTGTARDVQDLPRIPVTGTMVGNKFNVTVYWKGGNVGVYRGTVDAGGGMKGTTYDKSQPGVRATWYSNRSMLCAPPDATPPVAPTNPMPPVKSSGHMPASTPKPVKSSGKFKAPTIKANPIVLTIPAGQSHGTITLTWDGGPDHPDAEVWMKAHTQGGEETLVVQQGKGTRSMAVQGGINYAFMLKDAGQVLARTAVLTRQ